MKSLLSAAAGLTGRTLRTLVQLVRYATTNRPTPRQPVTMALDLRHQEIEAPRCPASPDPVNITASYVAGNLTRTQAIAILAERFECAPYRAARLLGPALGQTLADQLIEQTREGSKLRGTLLLKLAMHGQARTLELASLFGLNLIGDMDMDPATQVELDLTPEEIAARHEANGFPQLAALWRSPAG